MICIQETWLKTVLDFVIKDYDSICRDRVEGIGGGCKIVVTQKMQYRVSKKGKEWEIIVIKVWTKDCSKYQNS